MTQTLYKNRSFSDKNSELIKQYRSEFLWVYRVKIQEHQFDITASPVSSHRIDIGFSRISTYTKMKRSNAVDLMRWAQHLIVDVFHDMSLFKDKACTSYEVQFVDPVGRHISLYKLLVSRWSSEVADRLENKFSLENVVITNSSLVIFIQRS